MIHLEVSRHQFARVVRFEETRLESHVGVAYRVGFVERVLREVCPLLPHLIGLFFREIMFAAPLLKKFFLLGKVVGLFLSHNFPQLVRLAGREAREHSGEHHDLLLVDRHAVRFLKHRLCLRHDVGDWLLTGLTGDERGDAIHGAWAVERIHGYQIFKSVHLQLP